MHFVKIAFISSFYILTASFAEEQGELLVNVKIGRRLAKNWVCHEYSCGTAQILEEKYFTSRGGLRNQMSNTRIPRKTPMTYTGI